MYFQNRFRRFLHRLFRWKSEPVVVGECFLNRIRAVNEVEALQQALEKYPGAKNVYIRLAPVQPYKEKWYEIIVEVNN